MVPKEPPTRSAAFRVLCGIKGRYARESYKIIISTYRQSSCALYFEKIQNFPPSSIANISEEPGALLEVQHRQLFALSHFYLKTKKEKKTFREILPTFLQVIFFSSRPNRKFS